MAAVAVNGLIIVSTISGGVTLIENKMNKTINLYSDTKKYYRHLLV